MVWGAGGFDVPGADVQAVGAVFDAEGNACLVDEGGVRCFEDDGTEAWGVPVDGGVLDVVASDGAWALFTDSGVVVVDDATGDVIDEVDGVVGVSASGRMLTLDAQGLGEPGAGLVPVDDAVLDALELLVAEDGRVGALDPDGGLTWIGADGVAGERLDLDLAADGGLRAVALDDGFAVLDDEGLVLLDTDGQIRAEVDLRGRDLAVAQGELWVATADGVLAVDPENGAILDGRVAPGDVLDLAVVDDGDVLALLDVGARSLRVYDPEGPLHGDGHRRAVTRVTPAADGGAISVDAGGLALRWTSDGEPSVVGRDVHDAAWDGAGRLWLAREDAMSVRDGDGALPDVAVRADWLLGLSDGVLAGDGQALVRVMPDGTEAWRVDVPHDTRPSVAEGVVVLPSEGSLVVLDLETGARRRRLVPLNGGVEGGGLQAGGVAIGGLVVVGELDGLAGAWRPPVPRTLRALVARPSGTPALAPNGRWVAWPDDRALVVAETGGGPVFTSTPGGAVSTLATDDQRVFVGRTDGSVERWTVHDVVVDAPLPRFNGYAQLDIFHPVPEGPAPVGQLVRAGAIVDLAARSDGALSIVARGASWLEPAQDTTRFTDDVASKHIIVVDPPMIPTAVEWTPGGSQLLGGLDGRVVSVDAEGVSPIYQGQGPISAFCHTGDRVVLGTAAGVRVLDAEGVAQALSGMPARPVEALACGPEGAWVAAAHEGRIFLWLQAVDGARILTQGGPVRSLVALPDGSLVSGGDDEVAVVWDPGTWTPTYVLEGHEAPVVDMVVDTAQRRLVAVAGQGAVVWNLAGLVPEGRLVTDGPVSRVAMDREARQVWLGGADGRVHAFRLPRLDAAQPPALDPGIPTVP